MKKIRVFHPFVLAIFPILFLFSHNITESPIILKIAMLRLGLPILISVGITFLLWKLLILFFKDTHKSGIFLSATIFMFFSCGHFHSLLSDITGTSVLFTLKGVPIGPYKLYIALWTLLLSALLCVLQSTSRHFSRITHFLNTTSIVLLFMVFVNVGLNGRTRISAFEKNSSSYHDASPGKIASFTTPDIYYIILDEYAAATTLQEVYDYDNHAFFDFLAQKGFYIASEARSNYAFTVLSLASSLNMMYLDSIAHQFDLGADLETSDFQVPIQMVEENVVARFLKSKGYAFIHFRSGYPPTERNTFADLDVKCDRKFIQDRFIQLVLETTLVEPFFRRMAAASKRDSIQCQFSRLAGLSAEVESPHFVLAHFMVPHEPYVFGAHGEAVEKQERSSFKLGELYINQLQFTNTLVKNLIEALLSNAESPPVIILQADHGIRHRHPWQTHIKEWTGIFNAYYFPPEDRVPIYDSITPVNIFRTIFNYYFDTEFELLPDSSFFPVGKAYNYEFLDVSKPRGDEQLEKGMEK